MSRQIFPSLPSCPFGYNFELGSGFFPLDEVLLAIGFPEYFVKSFSSVSQFLYFTSPLRLGEAFFSIPGVADFE